MKKERITITIDQDVNKGIKILSKEESRNVSQMINLILKEHLERIKS